jgi:hypothetical protein
MSSVITTSLSDSLPSSVPKLDATGINWAIFFIRFQDAVEAKGFWGHFDGSVPCPKLSASPTAEETAAKNQWDKDERSAKSLLTQKIPDSTLMRVYSKTVVKDRWDAIVAEYTDKGTYAQTELRTKFLESCCPEKGNIREFLEGLRVKKEELAQVGVTIDEKDYLSTIISSLPYHLSNFASAQLTAAKMFAPTKSIEPDILMSLLMEEAERQKAQLARHAFRGKEEHDEALGVTDGSRPRQGRGRANITCWNCNKKGHYSNECEEPKKGDKSGGTGTAAGAESDSDSDFAWVVEEIEGEDWFEEAVAMTDEKCHESDWFDEVAESEDESDDEGGNSGGALAKDFGRVALGGAIVKAEMVKSGMHACGGIIFEDPGITGHVWPVHDDEDEFEGADRLSGAPIARFEGEYEGGGTTSESSGRMPDLDLLENPQIDRAVMEWRNHTIPEIDETRIRTRPPDDHRGGVDDPGVQVHKGCCDVGVIELMRNLEGPKEEFAICEECPSVPRFEGEEDSIQAETMDLPAAHGSPASIESPTAKNFDPPVLTLKTPYECIELPPSVVDLSVGCAKFFEGTEAYQGEPAVPISVVYRFEPSWDTGACKKGQGIVVDTHGGVGLPMVDVVIVVDAHGGVGLPMVGVGQLVRPPECVVEGRWRLEFVMFILIAFVEACHVMIASRRNLSRIGLRGSVGNAEANTPRDVFSRRRDTRCGILSSVAFRRLLVFHRT